MSHAWMHGRIHSNVMYRNVMLCNMLFRVVLVAYRIVLHFTVLCTRDASYCHAHTHTHTHRHVHVHEQIRIHYIYVHIITYTWYTYVYLDLLAHVRVCIYIYVYTYIHAHAACCLCVLGGCSRIVGIRMRSRTFEGQQTSDKPPYRRVDHEQ